MSCRLVLMVLANWTVMNSGTVKEAYILLLAMNLCGALTLLLSAAVTNRILKLWQASGLSFAQLVDRLVQLAEERFAERAQNETSYQAEG